MTLAVYLPRYLRYLTFLQLAPAQTVVFASEHRKRALINGLVAAVNCHVHPRLHIARGMRWHKRVWASVCTYSYHILTA